MVGSAMTDLVAFTRSIPVGGQTVLGERFLSGQGGKGANQAAMCALLDAEVAFVGCLGSDSFGAATLASFAALGIDTSRVKLSTDTPSGVAAIWVEETGENRIIIIPGANSELEPAFVAETVRSARPAAVLTQLEVPLACTQAALLAACEVGAIGVLNPAPMQELAPELLRAASWLIPNETEFEAISALLGLGSGALEERALACDGALGTDLVITLGSEGALVCREGVVERVGAPFASPLDTTGAGDAFVGAFAYALVSAASPAAAAAFGCACASASVEAAGAQSSFPRGELLDRLKQTLRGDSRSGG